MRMNSYRYYQADYRSNGSTPKKSENIDRSVDLFFII